MSQEKVDRYKEEKRNRKANIKKAKMKKGLGILIAIVIIAALAFWISISARNYVIANRDMVVTDINLDAITDFISNISAE